MVMMLQGCMVTSPRPAELIIGEWGSSLGGFPLIVEYRESTVSIGDNPAVPYRLTGNELTFADDGTQVRLVSFPDEKRMIQRDPVTGTSHEFKRMLQ